MSAVDLKSDDSKSVSSANFRSILLRGVLAISRKGEMMDWLVDVENRIKRKNQILFGKDSVFLDDLTALIREQNHQTLVLWAFECADETVRKLAQRYPDEKRPAAAVLKSKDWAAGMVKMREAQRAILQAHAAAKTIDHPEDSALCHAVGQACGVVHTTGHAIGFPIYELTAMVRHYSLPDCKKPVEARKQYYMERILYWQAHYADEPRQWADFMRD